VAVGFLIQACSPGSSGTHSVREVRLASAPGVTPDTLTIGTLYPLTGPAAAYSMSLQAMDIYFKSINDQGGIFGRSIKLVAADDQYVPSNDLALAKKLVEQDQVFALAGNLGSATTAAVAGYASTAGVPLLFVNSAAPEWSDAAKYPLVMGLPVPYTLEARILGKYIAKTWAGKKAAILYQNDDFGKSYLAYKEAVGPLSIAEEGFDPGAGDLSKQIGSLKAKGAEVFLFAGPPKQAGLALKAAADQGWKPVIILNSTAAENSLFGLAGGPANVEGAISAIWERRADDGGPEVQEVRELLAKYAPQLQFSQHSVTGYVIASLTAETLKRAGVNPTRQSLMAAAESFKAEKLRQLPPGSSVSTSKTDHAPIKAVQLVKATGGRFVPFGEAIS
jgi:branched-chain amino acid transport system substrate-binding protein